MNIENKFNIGQTVYLINSQYINAIKNGKYTPQLLNGIPIYFESKIKRITVYYEDEKITIYYNLEKIDYQQEERVLFHDVSEIYTILEKEINAFFQKQIDEIEAKRQEALKGLYE